MRLGKYSSKKMPRLKNDGNRKKNIQLIAKSAHTSFKKYKSRINADGRVRLLSPSYTVLWRRAQPPLACTGYVSNKRDRVYIEKLSNYRVNVYRSEFVFWHRFVSSLLLQIRA